MNELVQSWMNDSKQPITNTKEEEDIYAKSNVEIRWSLGRDRTHCIPLFGTMQSWRVCVCVNHAHHAEPLPNAEDMAIIILMLLEKVLELDINATKKRIKQQLAIGHVENGNIWVIGYTKEKILIQFQMDILVLYTWLQILRVEESILAESIFIVLGE